jgi:dTMP kinase
MPGRGSRVSDALFSQDPNRRGMLVTIDGPNGSGKTHLTQAIAEQLRGTGASVHSTHQPSPSVLGEFVRNSEIHLGGRGLACLVAADRHQQCEGEIADHLDAGMIVLCDRYVESSLVLQRIDEVETEFILQINAGIPRPDLRIRLLASPEAIRARLSERPPNPQRRLEQSAGAERELELYEEADRLLEKHYGVGSEVYDTTETNAEQLGIQAARLIRATRHCRD